MEYYTWVLTFHIMAMMSWMAMLFYLPRLFVYHVENIEKKEFVDVVKIQEYKIYKYIGAPAMWATIFSGIAMLLLNTSLLDFSLNPWMYAKLFTLWILIVYSFSLEKYRKELKKIKVNLAKNAQTQALIDLIENLSISQVEFLLENLKPENQTQFRKNIWIYHIQNNKDALAYVNIYNENKDEINRIEAEAAQSVPRWTMAVELFNNRFVDMPFTLSITNQSQTALGKENAKLKFIFKDNADIVEWTRSEIKTLSQGEKRALYLLNFIFEVESRKMNNKKVPVLLRLLEYIIIHDFG